jgi:hypothetical protein
MQGLAAACGDEAVPGDAGEAAATPTAWAGTTPTVWVDAARKRKRIPGL